MKLLVSALCCAALWGIPALAQKPAPNAMTDQKFVDLVAQTDMLEAHLGQMAQNQASAQDVKDYAQMLITDHTNDYQKLGPLAGKANLTVPNGLDAEHNKVIASFEKLNGATFDSHYIHAMIEGHTKAIEIFKKEAADAQSPDLKEYASETLSTLQKHLDGAKDLSKKGSK
jgi:putative membrane protein